MFENLVKNISVEWPTVVVTLAFVIAAACTYSVIRLVVNLVASIIGPVDEIEEGFE